MSGKPSFKLVIGAKVLTGLFLFVLGSFGLIPWLEHELEPVALNLTSSIRNSQIDQARLPIIVGIDSFYGEDVERGAVPSKPADPRFLKVFFQTMRKAVSEGNAPAAIGIDIDLSPGVSEEEPTEHKKLIDEAESFTKDTKIPVILGVGRTYNRSSEFWLESDLSGHSPTESAGMIAQLSTELEKYPDYFLRSSPEVSLEDPSKTNPPQKLYSLASRLGQAYASHSHGESPNGGHGPHDSQRKIEDGTVWEFYVDYSALDQLVGMTIHCTKPNIGPDPEALPMIMTDRQLKTVKDRVLILGRARQNMEDLVAFDNQKTHAGTTIYRGVYVHGCAFYSYGIHPIQVAHGLWFNFAEFVLTVLAFACSVAKLSNFQFSKEMIQHHFHKVSRGQMTFLKVVTRVGSFVAFFSFVITQIAIALLLVSPLQLAVPFKIFLYTTAFSFFPLFFRCIGQYRRKKLDENEHLGEAILSVTRWGLVTLGAALTILLLILPSRILWLGFVPSFLFILTEPHVAPSLEAAFDAITSLTSSNDIDKMDNTL